MAGVGRAGVGCGPCAHGSLSGQVGGGGVRRLHGCVEGLAGLPGGRASHGAGGALGSHVCPC